ncbi:UDP-N-acetylglucosamine transferase subunit ALG14 [Termitomyces sp. T112]|nr:UDP-N-acetylglucosamine transferase subunit ALG14 [Termitomyces sp. T112]
MVYSPLVTLLSLVIILVARFYLILPSTRPSRQKIRGQSRTCSLAVFLGSGGHTAEALTLVSALDFSRYTPRTYIICQGDTLSAQKATSLESAKNLFSAHGTAKHSILTIPRARQVRQSLLTTPPTAVWCLMTSIYLFLLNPVFRTGQPAFADVLLVNGPGTCFILCIVAYLNKFFGLSAPQIIYVESFARVQSLSLSGKLLRLLVDRFIVQWPQLSAANTQSEYRGWLV